MGGSRSSLVELRPRPVRSVPTEPVRVRPAPRLGDRRTRPRPPRGALTGALACLLAVAGGILVVVALAAQVSAPAAADAGFLAPVTLLPASPSAAPPAGAASSAPPARAPVPTHLDVTAIGVDTPVTSVGLAPDGSMEVPAPGPDYDHAAWYRGSVVPGAPGPAVIVGHVDARSTGPSVFFDLGRLQLGDRLEVGRADGSTAAFGVYAIRTVEKDAFPTAEVYGPTPGPELRLITCGGPFDAVAHRYRDNVVVFARAVP